MIRFWVLAACLLASCSVTPTHVFDLADAESDEDIEDATDAAREYLRDRTEKTDVRKAAAKTLGRLRRASPEVVAALADVLSTTSDDANLRSFAAWALGEMRAERSLTALVSALRVPMDDQTGAYLLEAIAKHESLMSRDQERLVEIVESMVFFSGNQAGRVPAIYDVLGDRTRTLPVNIKVLAKSVNDSRGKDPRHLAAVYNATYELLDRINRSKSEILASGASDREQLRAAVEESIKAFRIDDARTKLIALWSFGRLSEIGDIAIPAADGFVGAQGDAPKRPTIAESPALRLVAAWTLARLQIGAAGPRIAIARDLLPREIEPSVLALLADLYDRPDDYDELQKVVGETGQ